MKPFYFEILTPERRFFEGDCLSLIVPTTDGMLGIQAGHMPMTVAVLDGEAAMILPDGSRRAFAVARGFLDVSIEDVHLFCESALAPEEIDEAAEKKALEEAREQLREAWAKRDYRLTQIAIAQAINHLKVKNHNAEKMLK